MASLTSLAVSLHLRQSKVINGNYKRLNPAIPGSERVCFQGWVTPRD